MTETAAVSALKYVLSPGDFAAALARLEPGGESRQILRMFVNTLVWGGVGVVAVAVLAL